MSRPPPAARRPLGRRGARALALAAAVRGTHGRPPGRPRPQAPTPTPPRPRPHAHAAAAQPGRPSKPLRAGEQRIDAGDAGGVHALRARRHRHRRLPLLPARPAPDAGRVHHRHQRAARQPRRRAPRDPVPGPARPGRRGRGQGRRRRRAQGWTCFGGTGLERRARQPRRRALAGRLGAGRRRSRCCAQGLRRAARRRARGSSCRSTTTCSPAPRPTVSPPQLRLAPATRGPHAAARPCCCRRRSSCPAAPSTRPARCATATPPSPTCKARFGDGPGSTADLPAPPVRRQVQAGPVQTSCTRTVSQPDDDPRRRRPHAPARPLDQDRGQPRHARRADDARHPGLGLRQPGQPSRSSRSHLEPGDTVRVTCRHDQWLRDLLPAFKGQPDKYVVWGEGTTDEMCLGILLGHLGRRLTRLRSAAHHSLGDRSQARDRRAASPRRRCVCERLRESSEDGDRDHAGVVAPPVDAHPLGVRRERGCAAGSPRARRARRPASSGSSQARRTPACRHSRPYGPGRHAGKRTGATTGTAPVNWTEPARTGTSSTEREVGPSAAHDTA